MTTSPSLNSPLTSKINTTRGTYQSLGPIASFSGSNVFLFCNAETIANVFPDWIDRCELTAHFYVPFDLAMPISIPRRHDMREAYAVDPPLSEIGKICTQMQARELVARRAVPISAIYSGPTLASLQTAFEIAHFLKDRCGPIRINADLTSDRCGSNHWLSEQKLQTLGYKLDEKYEPLVSMEAAETLDSMTAILKNFMKHAADPTGNVIMVADSLVIKCISDMANGISRASINLQKAYEESEESFPPGATCTLKVQKFNDEILLEVSPHNIRPITSIGISTAQKKGTDMQFY